MCGILGIVTVRTHRPSIDDAEAARLRDLMRHRGPDDAGLWRRGHVLLGVRRLAVMDPTPAGRQPMVCPRSGCVLVYNGELYNDGDLRRQLTALGHEFGTRCDTETVLAALTRWGAGALERFRGMYGLGFYDPRAETLLLARDPLGVKPLYYTVVRTDRPDPHTEIVFASELPSILEHPGVRVEPDIAAVSGYLTTIRTTLGSRTLFAGVRTLRPGEVVTVDLAGDEPRLAHTQHPIRPVEGEAVAEPERTREVIEASVGAHLRSDVPTCCLLSGGLDSSIIAAVAADVLRDDRLHTFCAGAPGDEEDGDFSFARTAAEHIGCAHTEAPVTAGLFARRWSEMVRRQGVPLSTPNEVAINEVARAMRANGRVVTLSGEGADELFAGYELPMRLAAAHVAAGNEEPGLFQLHSNAWIPVVAKPGSLNPEAWRAIERDEALLDYYREEFTAAANETDDPLDAHLRFHRRVNLTGLLLRLDSATMLESIEGRTPYADREVAAFAQSLSLNDRYRADPCETKRPLRLAFADRLPRAIVERPKASFPLPFQHWMDEHAGALRTSGLITELFTRETIEAAATKPSINWTFAWPMMNLALWSQRWWGG